MTDIRSLERTLLDNLPWNKARIKFVARFLLALYAMRTVNLSSTETEETWLSAKEHLPSRSRYLVPISDQLRALRCCCLAECYQTFVL
jgi:hypothetical protein